MPACGEIQTQALPHTGASIEEASVVSILEMFSADKCADALNGDKLQATRPT